MRRIHPFLAATAVLAAVSAAALLPALTLATPASATATCAGTSLVNGLFLRTPIRVPTVGDATPNQWDCMLGPGDTSTAVARLQIDLNDCYGNNLTVDGIYGANTKNAVIAVQHREGVPQDGVYGPMTIEYFWYQRSGQPAGACDVIPGS
jgi:peptidoglycan hydrolase-like protein with peptidoglycan-binding domain